MKEKDVKTSGAISDEDNPIMHVAIEGLVVQFSVLDVKPDKREWLLNILQQQLAYVYSEAYDKAKSDISEARIAFLESME